MVEPSINFNSVREQLAQCDEVLNSYILVAQGDRGLSFYDVVKDIETVTVGGKRYLTAQLHDTTVSALTAVSDYLGGDRAAAGESAGIAKTLASQKIIKLQGNLNSLSSAFNHLARQFDERSKSAATEDAVIMDAASDYATNVATTLSALAEKLAKARDAGARTAG